METKPNMNIVSGFVSNINRRADRDVTKYLSFGLELMAVDIPMTVFIERSIFDSHIRGGLRVAYPVLEGTFEHRVCGGVIDGVQQTYSYMKIGHITFVFFQISDLFLWSYRRFAHRFKLNTGNPSKDTLEYMMVQCQKSEWMSIASQMNDKVSDMTALKIQEYTWVDFGAFHMFQGKIDVFQTELYKMRSRVNRRLVFSLRDSTDSSQVLFARCWDPNHVYYGDIYTDVNWLFAGSVFGGRSTAINRFALKVREKCLQVLRERNTLMWEINIWVLIYKDCPELFALYPSDHSEILFRGYQ